MYTIYLIEREDGLKYVGQTVDFNRRVNEHKKSPRFERYNIKSFEIIDYAENTLEAYKKEKYWIQYYDTFYNGLNMTKTGGYNHKEDSVKFSTLGVSYTKGTKWYNDGNINIRVKEGKEPSGFVKGKITRNPRDPYSEETKKKMSEARKGKVYSVKFTEDTIREILLLYKSRPKLEYVGEYVDAAKTLILSYERAFAKEYSRVFHMSANNLFGILRRRGGIAWSHLWKEIIGDKEIEVVLNKKRIRYNLTEDKAKNILLHIKNEIEKGERDLKDIIEESSIIFDIRKNYLHKFYNSKGGKKWRKIWEETIGCIDYTKTYKKNADVTEEKVRIFFEGFLEFNGTKKEFYMKAREYGLSEDKGRKLLYSRNRNGWKHIWDELNEDRNTN